MLSQYKDWVLPSYLRVGVVDKDLYSLLKEILNTIILIIVVTAIIYLMLNGLKFITSGGDSGKAQEAQKGITYAIIGIVIALSSAILVNFILERLGYTLTF